MALLLEWSWKSTTLLGIAWVATGFLRGQSAALRHRIWAMALGVLAIAPLLSPTLPAWHSRIVPALPVSASLQETSKTALSVEPSRAPIKKVPWIPVVWGVGAAIVILRLLAGTAWIRLRSLPLADKDCRLQTEELSRAFEMERPVRLFTLARATMPVTWGLFRPCIVLPIDFPAWPEERRRIVISHELAHIARGDWGWQIFAEMVKALYWFHPLVWLAARRLRQESEIACDDAVLNSGVQAADYASELLKLSRLLKSPGWLDTPSLAMARTSDLERRFTSMLNPLLNRRRLSRRAQTIAAVAVLAVLIPIAALRAKVRSGEVSGTVYDPDTAIVANATVTATSIQTHRTETKTTNAIGKYAFAALPAGTYEIRVSMRGFAYANKSVALAAGQDLTADLTLPLGGVKQTMEVVGKGVGGTLPPNSPPGPKRILVGGNVQATHLIKQVKPVYPEEAQAAGVEGSVELAALIGADGKLAAVRVLKSPGFGLDEAAMAAVREWRYEPTLLNGHPVQVTTGISVNFKLSQP